MHTIGRATNQISLPVLVYNIEICKPLFAGEFSSHLCAFAIIS